MNRRSLFTGIASVSALSLLAVPAMDNIALKAAIARVAPDPVPSEPGTGPVVFYTPHQDDETLFMGQIIAHHVLAGREVHVVLCCNGNLSDVLKELNGTIADNTWWGGTHYPEREGYEPFTLQSFGLKRTDELIAACLQLGVRRENIHFGPPNGPATSDLLPDAVSRAYADEVISGWADYFETRGFAHVGHYTMWWKDPHADHAALGQSSHALRVADPAKYADVRWTVKPEQATAALASVYSVPAEFATPIKFMNKKAGLCYGAWCPPFSFAIGYHSVGNSGGYFTNVAAGNPNYIVRNL